VIAATQPSSSTNISTAVITNSTATGTGRIRPLPTRGSRSLTKLRSGMARPRAIRMMMTTRNGTAVDTPPIGTKRWISDCAMPSTSATAKVSGNETNCPTSAAAIAGTTSSTRLVGSRKMIGAISTPASPPSAEPAAQLIAAIRSGERPNVAVARSFSATAVVSRPNVVRR
jgi:hypothetical protein